MQFEIIDQSDPYTMTAPDIEVAAVAEELAESLDSVPSGRNIARR